MGKKSGKRKQIAKKDRKNLRLWVEGKREEVLKPHIPAYTDALERGWRYEREYLQKICSEFHARFNWRLEDFEEPDVLPNYDLVAPPPAEPVDDDEKKEKRKRIDLLNERIRRWFKYRARRLRKQLTQGGDPLKDPWAVLMSQLSGLKPPPKARQAYQQYMRERYEDDVAPIVAERWLAQSSAGSNVQTARKPTAPFRAQIAQELFAALPEVVRNEYATHAKEEAATARAAYIKEPPSKTPEARQKCIDAVGQFLGPIQKGILEYTGLHTVVIMGGPIPRYGGELRPVYCAYGRSRAGAKAHMPEWAGDRWDKQVSSLMTEYLQTAFTPEEIQEAALVDPLEGAKYTMDGKGGFGTGSDSGTQERAAEGVASSSKVAGGKRKAGGKGKVRRPLHTLPIQEIIARTITGKEVTVDLMAPEGLSYDQNRTWNMARNSALLSALRITQDVEDLFATPSTASGSQKRKAAEVESGPRKSQRLNPDSGAPAPATTTPRPPASPPTSAANPSADLTPAATPAPAADTTSGPGSTGASTSAASGANATMASTTTPTTPTALPDTTSTPTTPIVPPDTTSGPGSTVVSTSAALGANATTASTTTLTTPTAPPATTPTPITPIRRTRRECHYGIDHNADNAHRLPRHDADADNTHCPPRHDEWPREYGCVHERRTRHECCYGVDYTATGHGGQRRDSTPFGRSRSVCIP
ncbi:hypothetical protein B0H16DRAFT_1732624 [Mycena metata]|uniref:Uncharacterized protein n=1 Tax=Mycena metata TaxID=1033252 RepID=A0AAD7MU98_9AGAR|nr:hypothetical protein B0H16DRAFT_1732624 [Mycena metata]